MKESSYQKKCSSISRKNFTLVEVLLAIILTSLILASTTGHFKSQIAALGHQRIQKQSENILSESLAAIFEGLSQNTISWKTIESEGTCSKEDFCLPGWKATYTFRLLDKEGQKDHLDKLLKVQVSVCLFKDENPILLNRPIYFCIQKDSVLSHDAL